jgi:hypothetical protein
LKLVLSHIKLVLSSCELLLKILDLANFDAYLPLETSKLFIIVR